MYGFAFVYTKPSVSILYCNLGNSRVEIMYVIFVCLKYLWLAWPANNFYDKNFPDYSLYIPSNIISNHLVL